MCRNGQVVIVGDGKFMWTVIIRMTHRLLAAFAVLACCFATACGSPTMCNCVNGKDCFGRGPIEVFSIQCGAVGSDEHCQLFQMEEALYCPTPNSGKTLDLTSASQWSSSDPTIAVVVSPGVIHTVGTGIVVISAFPPNVAIESVGWEAAFNLAPGTPAEQMVRLTVDIHPEPLNGSGVGGTINITPQHGPSQSCIAPLAMGTIADGLCRFSVFSGNIAIHATDASLKLAGDGSVQAIASGSFSTVAVVSLTPMSIGP